MADYVEIARRFLADLNSPPRPETQIKPERKAAAPPTSAEPADEVTEPTPEAPAPSLKGQAVELWRDGRRFFLVSDEEDAHEAMERFRAHRGEVWTSGELELVVGIPDQGARDEIEAFKRRLNGHLSLDTGGKGTPWLERHGLKGKLR